MARPAFPLFVISFSLIIIMPMAYGSFEGHKEVDDQWLQKLTTAKEKVSRLHFYVHNIPSDGPNQTAPVVAQSPQTSKSPTHFGQVSVIDDLLTEAPELASKIVGRAQGLVASSGINEAAFLMAFNFVFTNGEFSGSSLAMLGRNPGFRPIREMSIIGGTGAFRMARGIVITKTYQFNTATFNGIFE